MILTFSAVAAGAGLLLLVVGMFVAPAAVAVAYLTAYTATLAIAVGMLLLVMAAWLSGAVWFVLLRRQAEAVVAALPALAVLTLPLVVMRHAFFPAANIRALPFIARAVVYWAVWLACGERLYQLSRQQDARLVPASQFTLVCSAGIPATGLALTFASFDWMMSLSPGWSSSVYGAYYFAGAMVAALALLAILAFTAAHRGVRDLPAFSPTTEHFQALGRLMLAFVLLWAYLWYSQFFIMWIGDIPREVTWYLARLTGPWRAVAFTLVVTGFVGPFLVLAFRAARGSAGIMCGVGLWLFVVHYLDVYWLLVPSVRPRWELSDLLWTLGAIAFVAGATIAFAVWRHAAAPRVAAGDPALEWSVHYQAH
jgi:hypothetical protein